MNIFPFARLEKLGCILRGLSPTSSQRKIKFHLSLIHCVLENRLGLDPNLVIISNSKYVKISQFQPSFEGPR